MTDSIPRHKVEALVGLLLSHDLPLRTLHQHARDAASGELPPIEIAKGPAAALVAILHPPPKDAP